MYLRFDIWKDLKFKLIVGIGDYIIEFRVKEKNQTENDLRRCKLVKKS